MSAINMVKASTITRWMAAHKADYIDPDTDELNCTLLAEAACEALNGYENDDIPEEYFEAAFEASKR